MKKTLRKNIFRELIKTPGRFIAIFLIIMLSAGFYTGFGATGPSMKLSADSYFTRTQLADFRLLSDMGITEDDVAATKARPEVDAVMPGYNADVLMANEEGAIIYSLHSLPADTSDENDDYLSRVTLQKGRMPKAADECLADPRDDLNIGDRVSLDVSNDKDVTDLLTVREFTVTGIAQSPVYIALSRGNTTIGDGRVNHFLYLSDAAFDSEYYTTLSVRLKDTEDISAFSQDYKDAIDNETEMLEEFGKERAKIRYDDIHRDADKELADAEKKYNKAKKKADKKLADAKEELDDGREKLADGEKTYAENLRKIEDAEKEFIDGKEKIESSKAALKKTKEKLKKSREEIEKSKTELAASKAAFEKSKAEFTAQKAQYEATLLPDGTSFLPPEQAAAIKAQLDAAQIQLDAAEKQITGGEAKLTAGDKQLTEGEKKLSAGEKKLAASEKKLPEAEKKIDDGKAALRDARKELDDARKELDEGQAKYDKEKKKADKELADAKEEIDDGYKELNDLDFPEWFIMDREDNPEYSGFESDSDKINALSLTIPSFMYLVAALVCLTTMTRMVEDQRMQIGTLKALGYRRRQIILKYFFYAITVALLGGIIGVLIGIQLFPRAIWDAYNMLYTMDDMKLSVSLRSGLVGLLGGMISTTVATIAACYNELRSPAAELMRPKAPKAGKRVLLERMGFFWRRLSFTRKVTVRNLFRYKKRFIMTIIGVTGCVALLLTGFGIRDSIAGMVDLQYGNIVHSEITVELRDPSESSADTLINEKLDGYGKYLYVYETTVKVSRGHQSNGDMITYVYVPEDAKELNDYVTLRDRKHRTDIPFPSDTATDTPSVVVTEKIAKQLDAKIGNKIRFALPGEKNVEVRVAGNTENYIYNYIYLSPEDYRTLYGQEPEFTTIMLETDSIPATGYKTLLEDLVETDGVASAFSIEQVREMMDGMIHSLNSVIWIIILVAGLLALVVLYNLININITERKRELATLKVLGFYQKEVYAYISRESILLTLIGIVFGFPVGIALHRYVLASVEVSEVMFGRVINLPSYLYAAAFTIFCVIAVNLLMRPKIDKIDPVESLKSAE